MDEVTFLASVQASSPREFARLLSRPSMDEERVLRRCFGDECYRRWHELALQKPPNRRSLQTQVPVILIPDLFWSELFTTDNGTRRERLWLSPRRLIAGDLKQLRLTNDYELGDSDEVEMRVESGSAMKRIYGELMLTLARSRPVLVFGYDWRRGARQTARALAARIADWIGDDDAFHLVAHGFGGIIARTFIADHPERWEHRSQKAGASDVGRLIMLGTPNLGTYSSLRALAGLDGWIDLLAVLDHSQDHLELLKTLNSFPSLYQMLPWVSKSDAEHLYDPETYGTLPISRAHLEAAKALHLQLNARSGRGGLRLTADSARMVNFAGYGYRTPTALVRREDVDTEGAYAWSNAGDGVVPYALVSLESPHQSAVPTVYVEERHVDLAANRAVLSILDDLLTHSLDDVQDVLPIGLLTDEAQVRVRKEMENIRPSDAETDDRVTRLARIAEGLRTRSTRVRSEAGSETTAALLPTFDEEHEITDEILRANPANVERVRQAGVEPPTAPVIEIRVVLGNIAATDEPNDAIDTPDMPIDVVAVGHYAGLRPQAAVQDLDVAISRALLDPVQQRSAAPLRPDQRLLAQYADRGTITGELARLFFLPDPRVPSIGTTHTGTDDSGRRPTERLVAIAGMGWPGRFGAPELVVLARELCWVVGRFGKSHLATTLIGSGKGNLSVNDAIYGWSRGILAALQGNAGEQGELRRITFIHNDPKRVLELDAALNKVAKELFDQRRLTILEVASPLGSGDRGHLYRPMSGERRRALVNRAITIESEELQDRLKRLNSVSPQESGTIVPQGREDPTPTRLTLGLDDLGYRFSIMTNAAAVPERITAIDQGLVLAANNELATQEDPQRQQDLGRFVGQLLLPTELRPHLSGDAPVVLALDRSTARIHWEMVAQPDPLAPVDLGDLPSSSVSDDEPDGVDSDEAIRADGSIEPSFPEDRFLGTARGFTRQLRTAFAPPPEPPPPHRRRLRVLIVADPAPDASLEGAEREGAALLELFEAYNRLPGATGEERRNRVDVVNLFGPMDATRTRVLEKLINERFDVLHFAGHCWFDEQRPQACGWLFREQPRECLSANELNRIDRIPKFVFSNACQSGVTPLEPATGASALAPSFAESFFNRGVDNFVCTAWKVDDIAGLTFAIRLYEQLLGLRRKEAQDGELGGYELSDVPQPLWVAMRDARIAVAKMPEGARTWGAYQHYGNPFYRMFAPVRQAESGTD